MGKIQVLDKNVSELIAAGEVIERPASVIKELIENSIDAKATSITVEIRNGGISYIRITDNGEGIAMLEMPTAFLRHATSKIKNQNDLNSIMTLGFRGEALASIAAVAKVEMTSKQRENQFGGKFTIEGSEPVELEEVGCADGTTITIKDIFYNTPARLKFLKSSTAEGNYIAGLVDKIALSYPEISFRFIRDKKQELCTTGNGDLYSAVYSVFGADFAKTLTEVDYSTSGVSVKGYINIPHLSRANRVMQNFFVNGRYVKAPILTVSLEEAFKNSIMSGKFPACVLMIEISPEEIDINVHPAKTEIRFVNDKKIYDVIYFAVKNAIMNYSAKNTQNSVIKKEATIQNIDIKSDDIKQVTVSKEPIQNLEEIKITKTFEPNFNVNGTLELSSNITEYKTSQNQTESTIVQTPVKKEEISEFQFITSKAFEEKQEPKKIENIQMEGLNQVTQEYRIIGEIFKTYIIVQVGEEVAVIDKHAAHERYIFEQIKGGRMSAVGQVLLFPHKILMSRQEIEALTQNEELINQLGFSFEKAGDSEIKMTQIPSVIEEEQAEGIITEITQNLIENKQDISPDFMDTLYATISCKAAIKANDKNEREELEEIVKFVFSDPNLSYCPHGRPTVVKYTRSRFEKLFYRT